MQNTDCAKCKNKDPLDNIYPTSCIKSTNHAFTEQEREINGQVERKLEESMSEGKELNAYALSPTIMELMVS